MKVLFLIVGLLVSVTATAVSPVARPLPTEIGLIHLGMSLKSLQALVPSAEGIGGEGCYEVLFDSRDLEAVFPLNVRPVRAYMMFDGDQADSRLIYIQVPVSDLIARRLAVSYAALLSGAPASVPDDQVPREWSSSSTVVRFRFGNNAGMSMETADAEVLCSRALTFPRS